VAASIASIATQTAAAKPTTTIPKKTITNFVPKGIERNRKGVKRKLKGRYYKLTNNN
jgi:hypothetical protein